MKPNDNRSRALLPISALIGMGRFWYRALTPIFYERKLMESHMSQGNTEQVLRRAQDERQVVDFVRGELVEPHGKPTCSVFP
jgi:hypothetical protein